MIAFNGQYLDQASHGNMRITAACLGGQWVIDNRYMTHATQQAIIAAFGREEGKAVISRTNDYLNALALTDHTRAQQLAMFINEDPLLVTSLVETSKVRGVKCTKDPYIRTNFSLGDVSFIKCKYITSTTSGFRFGSRVGASGSKGLIVDVSPDNALKVRYYQEPSGIRWTVLADVTANSVNTTDILFDEDVIINNGNTKNVTWNKEARDNAVGNFGGYDGAVLIDIDTDIAHFIPHLRPNGEAGMLDIISGTFHPNANTQGAFTIALTDKTPLL